MAKRKQRPPRTRTGHVKTRNAKSRKAPRALPSSPPPDELTAPQGQARQEAIVTQEGARREDERQRQDDLRFNMLRSIITEPLLSKIHDSVRANEDEAFAAVVKHT